MITQKVILSYESYLNKEKNAINEGWKTWIATFMMLLNLGVVPPNIQGAELQDKIEWAQSIPPEQIAMAKFIAMLNSNSDLSPDHDKDEIQSLLTRFNAKNQVSLSLTDLFNSSKVETYDDDGGNTKYSWTMTSLSSDDISISGSVTKAGVKPASYMGGVSLVSDYGDFMTSDVEKQIHEALYNYEKTTGVEIAILTIPTFGDEDPSDYAVTVFNRWGIGKKGGNNGILVVTSMGDRKWHITTGYGMEDIFTDARCRQFGEEYLVSNFKQGEYEKGFQDLIAAMKAEFGSIPIERTKALKIKAEAERKEKISNFFTGVLEFLGLAATLSLLGYLIYVGIKKRRKLMERISLLKKNIASFDKEIVMLIDNGDPIFDDEKILAELKATNDKLKAKKLKGNKTIDAISIELDRITEELNDIKKIERNIRRIQIEIKKTTSQIDAIKTKSVDLEKAKQSIKKLFDSVNFDKIDISIDNYNKYATMFNNSVRAYDDFNRIHKDVLNIESQIGRMGEIEKELKNKLDAAKINADKVKEMGYDISVKANEEDIKTLIDSFNTIEGIYRTDIGAALNVLYNYDRKSKDLNVKLEEPIKKYNDIINAKKSIDNADEAIMPRMKNLRVLLQSGFLGKKDIDIALNLVDKFDESRGKHKHTSVDVYGEDDWEEGVSMSKVLGVYGILMELLTSLDEIIEKGLKNKKDKEDRLRREEEERRKKKKREEEEEEQRRNSYSSGSSYSSGGGSSYSSGGGSSFGGFGGGLSGGGGSSGSW
jgi:uncharacterized membrane protein YgcG